MFFHRPIRPVLDDTHIYGNYWLMKTTFELPDSLFREAKAKAASQGKTIRQFFTEAIRNQLRALRNRPADRPWMKHYGALKANASELKAVDRLIESEFEIVNPGDWQ